jgi:hypothetical protein
MNWEEACKILGVSTDASGAEINKQYIYKAQILHPDKTTGLPDTVRLKAEEELKLINVAYNLLKDPINKNNNPKCTPPKLSVSPQHIHFKDVKVKQSKTTIIKIENIGGEYTKFWMDDSPAPWLKVIEVKSTTNDPLPLEVTIEATNNSVLHKQTKCNLLIRIENEKTKIKDEITVKIELHAKAESKLGILKFFSIGFNKQKKPQVSSHNTSSTMHGQSASTTPTPPRRQSPIESYHRLLPDYRWHNDLYVSQLPNWIKTDSRLIDKLKQGERVIGRHVEYKIASGKVYRRLKSNVRIKR